MLLVGRAKKCVSRKKSYSYAIGLHNMRGKGQCKKPNCQPKQAEQLTAKVPNEQEVSRISFQVVSF